jgi:hypothetical protein
MQQPSERGQPNDVARALAVWRLERARRAEPVPHELARAAIAHYTDPGDLVLVPKLRGGELLQTAAALGRRALPLTPAAANDNEDVTSLRMGAGAALVLAALAAGASQRRLARVATRLLPLLRPGGFLALARGPRAFATDGLGDVVLSCQRQGLQYWQHVVALTPDMTEGSAPGAFVHSPRTARPRDGDRRALRCHHDLLVFRRPADAIADTPVAAAEAVAA